MRGTERIGKRPARASNRRKDMTLNVLLSLEPRISGGELIEPAIEFAEPWKDVQDRNRCPTTVPYVTIVDCQ